MDEKLIERAVEAAAKADCEALRRGHWDEQPDDFRDAFRSDVRPLVTAALADVEASITAEREDLAARVADELDRRKDEQRGIAALNSDESLAAHHYGAAKGYERSARLIREHLTKAT